MAKVGTAKASSIATIPGRAWNPEMLLKMKDRLDARGIEETPENVATEAETMTAEAMERMARAKEMQAEANRLEAEARLQRKEAEDLTSESHSTLSRRM